MATTANRIAALKEYRSYLVFIGSVSEYEKICSEIKRLEKSISPKSRGAHEGQRPAKGAAGTPEILELSYFT